MSYQTILVDQPADGVTRITLNRPDRLNAISNTMEHELDEEFRRIGSDTSVRSVILTGTGRAFCTGYDMKSLEGDADARVGEERVDYMDDVGRYLENLYDREAKHRLCLQRIWDLPQPVICAINGHAVAGGLEYAMMCDMTICAEGAKLGEPELRHVSGPPVLIMPWIIGWKNAKRLLLTGDLIDAQEALRIGLVNAVVSPEELPEQAVLLAERVARIPRLSVKFNKLTINRVLERKGLKRGLAINTELTTFSHSVETLERREQMKLAKEQGLRAYLELRDGWFNEQAKKLKV